MDAALAALIGAGIGAVVPILDGLRRDRRDEARVKRDRQDALSDRLFAHRREAVLGFVAAATAAIHGPVRRDETALDEPAFAELADAYAQVGLAVTQETWGLSRVVLDEVEMFIFGSGDRRRAQAALDSFVVAAQSELGQ